MYRQLGNTFTDSNVWGRDLKLDGYKSPWDWNAMSDKLTDDADFSGPWTSTWPAWVCYGSHTWLPIGINWGFLKILLPRMHPNESKLISVECSLHICIFCLFVCLLLRGPQLILVYVKLEQWFSNLLKYYNFAEEFYSYTNTPTTDQTNQIRISGW